jgi:hypothetical protein
MSSSPRRVYLTTPIYYASGEPHIGHAYTTFLADALARYHRQAGARVLFLTGTDEHGQKIQEEASRRGVAPQELCDQMAGRFQEAWQGLEISYDRFIRTTEAEHKAVVRAFVQRLHDRGHIYAAEYEGWYSVHEERFFTEKELGPGHTDPIAGRPVERIREKNWFFRMSAFQEDLVRHIEDHPEWIFPETRRNEVLGFLQKPLEDLSISRPRARLEWGIPLPFDEEHVTYVWVDALINYLTASGAIRPGADPAHQGFDAVDAAGNLAGRGGRPTCTSSARTSSPRTRCTGQPFCWARGFPFPAGFSPTDGGWWATPRCPSRWGTWWTPWPSRRRSGPMRSAGTCSARCPRAPTPPTPPSASSPVRRAGQRPGQPGLPDPLHDRPVPGRGHPRGPRHRSLAEASSLAIDRFHEAMEALRVNEALGHAMDLARVANGYVESREPWSQAKDPAQAAHLDETLASLARVLVVLAALLLPAMPIPNEGAGRPARRGRRPDAGRGTGDPSGGWGSSQGLAALPPAGRGLRRWHLKIAAG